MWVGASLRRKFAMCVAQQLRVVYVARPPDLPEQRRVRVQPTAIAQEHAPSRLNSMGVRCTSWAVPIDRAPREVDGEPAFNLDALVRCVTPSPPQRRAHARDKLARSERLGHVVVRAGVQCADLLVLLVDRRQDDEQGIALHSRSCRHRSTPSASGSKRCRQ